MHWKIKALLQKTLSKIPFGDQLNHLSAKQAKHYHEHVFKYQFYECLRKFKLTNLNLKNSTHALEIGTGYSIISPVILYLLGFKNSVTVDISNDIKFRDFKTQFKTIHQPKIINLIVENSIFNRNEILIRINNIESTQSLQDLFKLCNITYIPNYKIEDIEKIETCYDYIYSQVVLEHVFPKVLDTLFSKFNIWLKPNGFSVHTINFIDHFSNPGFFQDKKIPEFNFLRYSDKSWQFWSGNPIAFTNRLSYIHYLELCKKYNFKSYYFQGENYRDHKHLDENLIHNDVIKKYKKINILNLQKYQRGTLVIQN